MRLLPSNAVIYVLISGAVSNVSQELPQLLVFAAPKPHPHPLPRPDVLQDIGNGLAGIWQAVQNIGNQIGQEVKNIGNQIGQGISQLSQDVQAIQNNIQNAVSQDIASLNLDANGQTAGGPASTILADFNLLSNLTRATVFSSIAYCSPTTLQQFSCSACTSNRNIVGTRVFTVATSSIQDVQGFVAVNPSQSLVVIAFRGTANNVNWANNIAGVFVEMTPPAGLFPAASNGILVHSGFLNDYLSLRDQIQQQVTAAVAANPSFKVLFTGHSLGGAMATLATVDFLQHNVGRLPAVSLLTMGEPRVGNSAFATMVDTTLSSSSSFSATRLVNRGDPVPHIVPFKLGFLHRAEEVWTSGADGQTYVCHGGDEATDCSNTLSITNWNPKDHLSYLGVSMSC